jgi:hypothetical protein
MEEKSKSDDGLKLNSLKLLVDWGKWILTIEAAICTALWKTGALKLSWWAFVGWTAFCLSAMVAAVLLIVIPRVVQRGSDGVDNKRVHQLAGAECGLFLIGTLCLMIHALQYLSPLATTPGK